MFGSLSFPVVLVSCSPVCHAHTRALCSVCCVCACVARLFLLLACILRFVCVSKWFYKFKLLFQFFVSYKAHQTPRNGEPIGQADNLQCFDINKLTTYLGVCLFLHLASLSLRRAHWLEAHEQQNHYTLWCCGFCDRFWSLPIFMCYFRIGKVSV